MIYMSLLYSEIMEKPETFFATIDQSGRITIPKDTRQRTGLGHKDLVEVKIVRSIDPLE